MKPIQRVVVVGMPEAAEFELCRTESLPVTNTIRVLPAESYAPADQPQNAATMAIVAPEGAAIRFEVDGTDPTRTTGTVVSRSGVAVLFGIDAITDFKTCRVGDDNATLVVSYFRRR
jgi:hypothetical protein